MSGRTTPQQPLHPDHDPIWQVHGFGWKCICGADLPSKKSLRDHVATTTKESR